MKIAFFEVEDWEVPFLKKNITGHTLTFNIKPLTEDDKGVKDIEILSVFIYSTLNEKILSRMPRVKLIVTRSTGFDHIDLAYCKKKKITVCNVPNYGANTVAEHTFSLLLGLSRNLVPSIERTRRGNFELDGLRGFDLHGKTLGVVGLGNIGSEVVRIAKGFGMKTVVYTRNPSEELARKIQITFLSLKELLRISDVVTLHIPYTKKTHHLINVKNIKSFKKGSILLNTARGGIVETEAILYGLNNGILRGVGLDVLEEECGVKEERQLLTGKFLQECDLRTQLLNHVLLTKENVLITPHNAFNSQEALQTILRVTIDNVHQFLQHDPVNVIIAQ